MKSIFKSGFFKVILLLLAGGITCLVLGGMDYSDSRKTPINFNEMKDSDFQKGAIIEGDLYYNYGIFETIENKRNGHTESTNYRYIIPMGDESYVGIQFTNADEVALMDKQTDETYDMMDGKIEDTTTVIHFKGKVCKMDNEDYGYFKDFMKSGGFSDDEIAQYGSEYYIQVRKFGEGPLIMILGIVFLVIDAVIIAVIISKAKKMTAPQPAFNQGTGMNLNADSQATFNQTPTGFDQQPQGPQLNQQAGQTDFSQYFQDPQQPQGPQGPTNFQ